MTSQTRRHRGSKAGEPSQGGGEGRTRPPGRRALGGAGVEPGEAMGCRARCAAEGDGGACRGVAGREPHRAAWKT